LLIQITIKTVVNKRIFEILRIELFKIKPNIIPTINESNINNKKLTKGNIKNKLIRSLMNLNEKFLPS